MTTFTASETPAEESVIPPAEPDVLEETIPEPDPSVPAEVDPEPEIEIIEPETGDPDPVESLPAVRDSTAPAVVEQWTHQTEWTHDWLEFKGDKLGIRIPKSAALQAVSASRHSSLDFQDRLVNLFVVKHLSPETYERVMYRMIDPDDEDFTSGSWNELLAEVAKIGAERAKAEADALAAVTQGKGK